MYFHGENIAIVANTVSELEYGTARPQRVTIIFFRFGSLRCQAHARHA